MGWCQQVAPSEPAMRVRYWALGSSHKIYDITVECERYYVTEGMLFLEVRKPGTEHHWLTLRGISLTSLVEFKVLDPEPAVNIEQVFEEIGLPPLDEDLIEHQSRRQ